MKNHTESSKMHVGQQAAKPRGWWTSIKSRQWKNSISKPEHPALVSSEPWTGVVTGLISDTWDTTHPIWGGQLPTTALGTHLLRKWIFPRNCSFVEQHRTHQVLGVLLCISSHGPEGLARLMGFLLTALWVQAAHTHHRGSRELHLTMENKGISPGGERKRPLL